MKRLVDILVALIILVVLSPLLVIAGLMIRFESNGPVFFRQNRVGLDGKLFSICKFRSMFVSSDLDASYNTQHNDPRITRVGHFIRATSIDELPQLFNVLKGEMSVVGPRPDLEIQERDYSAEDWRLRNSVRPGMTGLAQVNGRSNISLEDRLHYDLLYARTHNFLLDTRIILKTVKVILFGMNVN